ncbi:MAG: tRNA guanosine(34) transglycosylase Tgt [Patescibacteria group bacterium]|jgi:queuine tRNA-ribosyltransferase
MKNGQFKLIATSGKARAGELQTAHGLVQTPCFMPVGTKASVKSLDPTILEQLNAQVVLANTYHLAMSPGSALISKQGGLHNFMQWNHPILTDSGGFQVFSLGKGKKNRTEESPDQVIPEATITEDGVTFKSHRDGSEHLFTPEIAMKIQAELGADIIMAFDECPPYPSTRAEYLAGMERTHRWLTRCINEKKSLESSSSFRPNQKTEDGGQNTDNLSFRPGERVSATALEKSQEKIPFRFHQNSPSDQLLFGIVQGGVDEDLRKTSAKFVASQNLPGVAIGGVANGGESRAEMVQQVEWALAELPQDKPRYLMGIGTPLDLLDFITRGIDMFDCVLPTRLGRNGAFWMVENGKGTRVQIKNSRFTNDSRPLTEGCKCATCTRFSRAYVHHLFVENEPLSMQLLSIHNIFILIDLTHQIRQAIIQNELKALSTSLRRVWKD